MKAIAKLKSNASNEDIIKKLNEIIEVLNAQAEIGYTPHRPSAYDLNAVSKILKRQ